MFWFAYQQVNVLRHNDISDQLKPHFVARSRQLLREGLSGMGRVQQW